MVELIGIAGITGVLAGSLLLSLFIAQSLVNCVVIVMARASAKTQSAVVSGNRNGGHVLSGQRSRPVRA
jgi:hypothetical protein